jgi:hypothetical protein
MSQHEEIFEAQQTVYRDNPPSFEKLCKVSLGL